MKKPPRSDKAGRKRQRAKRKNPLRVDGLPGIEQMLADSAGNLLVTHALRGCTFVEKALIAAIMPMIVNILRSVPTTNESDILAKLFPDGVIDVPSANTPAPPPTEPT